MPEGDVVLRAARRLTQALSGPALTRSELRWPDLAGIDLTGRRVLETVSVGKNLLTRIEGGQTLHTHLRMDGTWHVHRTTRPGRSFSAPLIRAVLGTHDWTCVGHQLGMMAMVRTRDEARVVGHLGPDVLGPDLDAGTIGEIAESIRAQGERAIGEVLLDQRVLAGLGTIYMAETLFRHRISPWRRADQVPEPELLVTTSRRLMQASADAVAAPGHRGSIRIVVHGRAGLRCVRCTNAVASSPIGRAPYERPAFYCPTCQPR